ncbi:MAG: ABC transporter ATP-binding protein [Dysosmobacter sp.]
MSILEVSGLRKVYTSRLGGSRVEALRNVSFTVEQGEYVAIMGESGSGKTTLLNILAALDEPTAGTVRLDGHELGKIRRGTRRPSAGTTWGSCSRSSTCWIRSRWRTISICRWCDGNVLRGYAARLLPIARELGRRSFEEVPYEVPAGEARAAVARAIITEPKLLLADEPTGALDSGSTDELLRLFAAINRAGQTILMVTHSVKAASRAGRVLFIKDGQVFHQLYRGEDDDTRFYQRISDTLTMLQSGGEPA